MKTKTTITKAKHFVRVAANSRPATGGNKRVTTRAKRQGDQWGGSKRLFRSTRTAATLR